MVRFNSLSTLVVLSVVTFHVAAQSPQGTPGKEGAQGDGALQGQVPVSCVQTCNAESMKVTKCEKDPKAQMPPASCLCKDMDFLKEAGACVAKNCPNDMKDAMAQFQALCGADTASAMAAAMGDPKTVMGDAKNTSSTTGSTVMNSTAAAASNKMPNSSTAATAIAAGGQVVLAAAAAAVGLGVVFLF